MEKKISKFGIANELVRFFMQDRWWWLTPAIIMLLACGFLVIFAQSSAIAPYIYVLF